MDIVDYFIPVDVEKIKADAIYNPAMLGSTLLIHTPEAGFPDTTDAKIAIMGVEDGRRSVNNFGCAQAPDVIRKYLYQLYANNFNATVIDLGNIKPGHKVEDTYFAVSKVCSELISHKIIPVIIGGGNDIAFAQYQAYEKLAQTINMVAIDNNFNLGDADEILNSNTYLGKIILQQPNYLFNYSNIGYQTYLSNPKEIDLMAKLYFDVYRLGQAQANMEDTEPIIRNADMVSLDISAIRQSDASGSALATPNGFYGEQACQMARYAGMSDKLTSFGIYEINPSFDARNQTSHLAAQIIWCFIEGYCNRKQDFPFKGADKYTKYRVVIKNNEYEITFFKSGQSDRWWMEVPYPPDKRLRYERHYWVPCSYTEYQEACNDEMPDRWWQTFQKLG